MGVETKIRRTQNLWMIGHAEDWGRHTSLSLEIINFLLATLFQRFILLIITNLFCAPTLVGQGWAE
tara:strand:+ start:240 stop:437 length:198 start_codon:yes stop_codon:yes gene_type:complete